MLACLQPRRSRGKHRLVAWVIIVGITHCSTVQIAQAEANGPRASDSRSGFAPRRPQYATRRRAAQCCDGETGAIATPHFPLTVRAIATQRGRPPTISACYTRTHTGPPSWTRTSRPLGTQKRCSGEPPPRNKKRGQWSHVTFGALSR
jgi:hypothetical protein